jgi:hypothetical protein
MGNTKHLTKSSRVIDGVPLIQSPYLCHFTPRQFGLWEICPLSSVISALFVSILHVVQILSKKVVVRIAAQRSITGVAYNVWTWVLSVVEKVRYSVGSELTVSKTNNSVATTLDVPSPHPAQTIISDINKRPELKLLICSQFWYWSMLVGSHLIYISRSLVRVAVSTSNACGDLYLV